MELEIEAPSGSRTIDISLDRPVHDALAGINALERTAQAVDADGTIHGTSVEAHRIAALVEGDESRMCCVTTQLDRGSGRIPWPMPRSIPSMAGHIRPTR